MRLVLDTNVVVSGLLWHGTPRLLLEGARERRVELFTSIPLLAELTETLRRSKFDNKIAASLLTVDQIVDGYAALARLVRPIVTPRISSDPDDDVVIGTALAAKAESIISGDSHLLELMNFRGIDIVTAAVMVSRIK
ncbi:MAG TPA: putative toxin-antitoxin system toxin component, PIN family [Acidobacteriaceae bacterium]|nr:putative toxin-antitoxin system toxin component, PIN family [Acidobacteriaceae bacterium]